MAQTSEEDREKIYKEYGKLLKERRVLEKRRAEEYAAAEEKERRRK